MINWGAPIDFRDMRREKETLPALMQLRSSRRRSPPTYGLVEACLIECSASGYLDDHPMQCKRSIIVAFTVTLVRPIIQFFHTTLSETNSSHLKIGHPKRKFIFQASIFRCFCC